MGQKDHGYRPNSDARIHRSGYEPARTDHVGHVDCCDCIDIRSVMRIQGGTMNVQMCSACGQNHADLEAEYVEPPVEIENKEYNLVAECPTTGILIYIQVSTWPVK